MYKMKKQKNGVIKWLPESTGKEIKRKPQRI